MTTVELLKKFKKLNVKLWVEEGRLRYSAAKGVLTPELREELSARKEEVLSFLHSVVVDGNGASSGFSSSSTRAADGYCLVKIQPEGTKQPLFFVHAVNGSAFGYMELASQLGAEHPFYAFQSKGLEGDHEPHARIADMAGQYVAEMRAVQAEGPYLLGGWSMGGLVASEMARQLNAEGQRTNLLLMIDSFVPSDKNWNDDAARVRLVKNFAYNLGLSPEHFNAAADEVLNLEVDDQLRYLLDLAVREKVVHSDFKLPHLRRLFNVYQHNVQALRDYTPSAVECPVVLVRASHGFKSADPTRGWGGLAAGGLEVREAPGNHYTVLHQPNVRIVAEHLLASINTLT